MSRHRKTEVFTSLARHLGVAADATLARAELQRDLHLEPLDVVLFVLSFEESEDITFRFEDLEHTLTAGELVDTVAGWLDEYDRNERFADAEEASFARRGAA
ncbi:MAG TPA: hypothetical protein VMI54_16540 [Polyangiaceae bacterium]|nr:hypothetical protein [Polyangiaceae bacterium]